MHFCSACGVLLAPSADGDECEDCDPAGGAPILSRKADTVGTELEKLPSTKSGHVRKRDAMAWLENLEWPTGTALRGSVLPKPAGFEGRTYETDISNVRLTGDARFVETAAGLLAPLLDLENTETRLEINLQRTRVRDTRDYTGNYALYLSVAERSGR